MRKEGFEPSRPFGHTVLSRARLPFRHFRAGQDKCNRVGMLCWIVGRSVAVPVGGCPPIQDEVALKVEYIEETAVRKALAFEIEPEVVGKEIEARFKEFSRHAKLPGFRPGKIPAEVIR